MSGVPENIPYQFPPDRGPGTADAIQCRGPSPQAHQRSPPRTLTGAKHRHGKRPRAQRWLRINVPTDAANPGIATPARRTKRTDTRTVTCGIASGDFTLSSLLTTGPNARSLPPPNL
jgi:hypothetical protein